MAVAGCGSAGGYPAVSTYAPQGGVQAYSPTVTLNDVWLDAPEGVPRGGAADLRLYAVNDFSRRDALTGVTSPLVQDDRLRLDGRPVAQIPLPRGEAVNFEWSNRSGVRLTGFRRPLPVASWMPISLHFAHSKTYAAGGRRAARAWPRHEHIHEHHGGRAEVTDPGPRSSNLSCQGPQT